MSYIQDGEIKAFWDTAKTNDFPTDFCGICDLYDDVSRAAAYEQSTKHAKEERDLLASMLGSSSHRLREIKILDVSPTSEELSTYNLAMLVAKPRKNKFLLLKGQVRDYDSERLTVTFDSITEDPVELINRRRQELEKKFSED